MIAAIGPEQLGVLRDLPQRVRRNSGGARHDLFQHSLLAQAVGGQLVKDDRMDRDGCLGQPVRQGLLLGRQ